MTLEKIKATIGFTFMLALATSPVWVIGSLVIHDSYMETPATAKDFMKLKAVPGTCAPHTMKIRIKDWRDKDPNYKITRRNVNAVVSDCTEYIEKQFIGKQQDAALKVLE